MATVIEYINMYYNLIYDAHADIIIICRSLCEPRLEVIQMPEALFAGAETKFAAIVAPSRDQLEPSELASV